MNKKINSVPSAETKDEVSANVEVTTSSPNNAKPHVVCSLNLSKPYEQIKKEIYTHLFLHVGGVCQNVETGDKFGLTYNMLFEIFYGRVKAVLLLRKLATITKDEMWEAQSYLFKKTGSIGPTEINMGKTFMNQATTTKYLLKKRFDLFGLIDAGLAIEDLSTQ